ncbi:MAG TPA: hypothetical protein VN765_08100, partial [Candidatus Acidoferrum sp.]|nr:hypothetical protein [Candidatus Acidoferrum sp.]
MKASQKWAFIFGVALGFGPACHGQAVAGVVGPVAMLAVASAGPKAPAAPGSGLAPPPSASPAKTGEWGEPVEGLSVRLQSEKTVWDEREVGRTGMGFAVIFKASVRNHGSGTVLVAPAQETGELEVDGVWHKWTGAVEVKSSALAPGRELDNIAVMPDNKWRSATGAREESPGKHKFRFAVLARRGAANRGEDIRAVSNPIEVEFLPSAQQLREAGAPLSTNHVGVWFSGHVVDDETGELMTNFLMQLGVLDPRKSPETVWSDGPMSEPNFIGGQWSRNPEPGGFWGMESIESEQKGWARIVASGYLKALVSPEPVAGYADVNNLTVRMKRGAELTGVVLNHSGQPAAAARVFLIDVPELAVMDGRMGWWGTQFQNGTGTTDVSGHFALRGDIKAAKGVVVVTEDSRMVWAVTNAGLANEMKITLPEPASIIVHYDIAGDEAQAQLGLRMRCGEMNHDFRNAIKLNGLLATVANHGQLVLTNLSPGAYDFWRVKGLSIGDPAGSTGSNPVRASNRGRSVLEEQRTIIVQAGEVRQVNLVRDTGFAVSGQVTGLEMTGAPGAYIFVRPAGETNDSRDIFRGGVRLYLDGLTCARDGNFQTQRLKPGTYCLVAEADGPTNAPPAARGTRGIQMDPGYTGAVQVTIPNEEPPAPVKIELHRRVAATPVSPALAAGRASNNTSRPASSEATNTPGITLEIRCAANVFKVGDEIPVDFVFTSHRTNDYFAAEHEDADGRLDQYKLVATMASGEVVPDPRGNATNSEAAARRIGRDDYLHPGGSLTRNILLNRWALIQEPGRYEITGISSYFISPSIHAKSDPISITVLARSKDEMDDYIRGLTNQVAERLAKQAGKTAKAYDPVLHELALKLMFTCRPEIVPSLFKMMEESSHEGRWFYEALAYYVPHTEDIRQALIAESAKLDMDVNITNGPQSATNETWTKQDNPDAGARNWLRFAIRNHAVTNEA